MAYTDGEIRQFIREVVREDLKWKVTFINENGEATEVKGKTRTGRSIVRRQISSENIGTSKIKQLIRSIQSGKEKDNGAESSGGEDNGES